MLMFLSAFLSSCRLGAYCKTKGVCLEYAAVCIENCIGMNKCSEFISLVCEMAHIALRFGPFRSLKRPVLQCKIGRFATYCVPECYVGDCRRDNWRYVWESVSAYIKRYIGMYGKILLVIKKTVFPFSDSKNILYLCNIKIILKSRRCCSAIQPCTRQRADISS